MKKLNVYSVYLDDGKDVFRVTVPAASKKDAAEYVRGNGDVVAIKPADLQDIDLDALADTLKRAQWGQMEIDIIGPARPVRGDLSSAAGCCCPLLYSYVGRRGAISYRRGIIEPPTENAPRKRATKKR